MTTARKIQTLFAYYVQISTKSQLLVKQEAFSFWGLRPRPSDQGLCPWTPLGAQPLDPRYLPKASSPPPKIKNKNKNKKTGVCRIDTAREVQPNLISL